MGQLPHGTMVAVGAFTFIEALAGYMSAQIRLKHSFGDNKLDWTAYKRSQYHMYCWQRLLCIVVIVCVLASVVLAGEVSRLALQLAVVAWSVTYLVRTRLGFCLAGQKRRDLRIKRNAWFIFLSLAGLVTATIL